MQKDFKTNLLYPLQDKVLIIMSKLDVDFYLTGGTALSRGYFHHRYSDDLDFFLNQSPSFDQQVELTFNALQGCNINLGVKSESYARCFVSNNDITLKLDFVNDVLYRRGNPENKELYFKTDNVLNILSNKISALSRNEPKDIADIIEICKASSFSWIDIIADAKEKDLSVDELDLARFLAEFNAERLTNVNWIKEFDLQMAKIDLAKIAQDIFNGRNNSLHQ